MAAQVEGGVGGNIPVLRLLQEVGQAWVQDGGRGWGPSEQTLQVSDSLPGCWRLQGL